MLVDPRLIDDIYEAAVVTDGWPDLLQRIGDQAGSSGAVFLMRSPGAVTIVAAPRVQKDVDAFLAEGWADDPYSAPLLHEHFPGFRCLTHYHSIAEIEALPIYREFFRPRGFIGAAATVVQGPGDDMFQFAFDGFPSFAAAEAALPYLDALRPHLARAISLTAQLMVQRARMTVEALSLAGIGAAIVSREGRLKAANPLFGARMGSACDTVRHRLHFADRFLDQQFRDALAAMAGDARLRSIGTRTGPDTAPLVVHLLPLHGAARSVCDSDGILLLVATATNAGVPGADLLRMLFDLTPAEARLTRLIVAGEPLAAASATLAISINTARVHLRSVFSKTGVNRQADLQALLTSLVAGQPGTEPAG